MLLVYIKGKTFCSVDMGELEQYLLSVPKQRFDFKKFVNDTSLTMENFISCLARVCFCLASVWMGWFLCLPLSVSG